jgi:hypothetical protein
MVNYFFDVTPHIVGVVYRRFKKNMLLSYLKMLKSILMQEVSLKHRNTSTTLHGVISQKTGIFSHRRLAEVSVFFV